jgi:hypothetical protein
MSCDEPTFKAAAGEAILFVRSLVGLDRQAAKDALAGFLSGKALSANQIEFVGLIVRAAAIAA